MIRSKANGEYVGFPGGPRARLGIITGTSDIAKVWDIDVQEDDPLAYKCDHPFPSSYQLLSSTSSDRIKLHGNTRWVIEFDKQHIHTGIHAHLEREEYPTDTKQVWVFSERESYSQELSHFIL